MESSFQRTKFLQNLMIELKYIAQLVHGGFLTKKEHTFKIK